MNLLFIYIILKEMKKKCLLYNMVAGLFKWLYIFFNSNTHIFIYI